MISIIIRSKNEMPWIKYTLQMLEKQSFRDFEVVAVDSGSTDGSYEQLLDYKPAVLYQIEPQSYIPGRVLNEAIRHCKGDIIVFNNADCIPQQDTWLQNLVAPLMEESSSTEKRVACFCRQVPRPNAFPLVRKDYERAFGDGSIHRTWRHFFSLASSAVKKDIITRYPFDNDIQYSEDIEWSWRMKELGYEIYYQKDAVVEHSHNYDLAGIAKRFTGEGRAEAKIYKELYQKNPELWIKDSSLWHSVILSAGAETLRDIIYLINNKEYGWILQAPLYRFMQRYFTYKGRVA